MSEIAKSRIMVFSESEMAAWRERGWIILEAAVPPEQCALLVDAIFRQLRQDPDDPATWYPREYPQPHGRSDHHDGFLAFDPTPEFAATRALQWQICQNERIYRAHAQLLGEHRLRMGMQVGRAYMKPPYIGGDTLGVEMSGPLELPDEKIFHRRGGDIKLPGGEMALHFDTSLDDIRRGEISGTNLLQGNISLTDTPGDAGGTCLLPGFHHEILEWVQRFPPLDPEADTWATDGSKGGWPGRNANTAWPHAFDAEGVPLPLPQLDRLREERIAAGRVKPDWVGNLNHPELAPFQHRIRSIPTKCGDLLIWHRGCPHGNGYNLTKQPRMAQFVDFSVLGEGQPTEEEIAASTKAWQEVGAPPMSDLNRKVAGLEPWGD
jgi:hypothetical protein